MSDCTFYARETSFLAGLKDVGKVQMLYWVTKKQNLYPEVIDWYPVSSQCENYQWPHCYICFYPVNQLTFVTLRVSFKSSCVAHITAPKVWFLPMQEYSQQAQSLKKGIYLVVRATWVMVFYSYPPQKKLLSFFSGAVLKFIEFSLQSVPFFFQ